MDKVIPTRIEAYFRLGLTPIHLKPHSKEPLVKRAHSEVEVNIGATCNLISNATVQLNTFEPTTVQFQS